MSQTSQLPIPEGPRQKIIDEDVAWARSWENRKRYGGQFVAVHNRRVIAATDRPQDMWEALAKLGADIDREEITIVPVRLPFALPDNEFDWCLREPTFTEYNSWTVVIFDKKILARGKDRQQAWQMCQQLPDCPSLDQVAFVFVPWKTGRFSKPGA